MCEIGLAGSGSLTLPARAELVYEFLDVEWRTVQNYGDVIACGTFAGTGWPVGRFLRPGDTVRAEVIGIGHLEDRVVAHCDPRRPHPRRAPVMSSIDAPSQLRRRC